MRIEIEISNEYESDYINDKFEDLFSRIYCGIRNSSMCSIHEREMTLMLRTAFHLSTTCDERNHLRKTVESLNSQAEILLLQMQKYTNKLSEITEELSEITEELKEVI